MGRAIIRILQYLSRIGVCSSRDTLDRLKTSIVPTRASKRIQDELTQGSFGFTTIENLGRSVPGKRVPSEILQQSIRIFMAQARSM